MWAHDHTPNRNWENIETRLLGLRPCSQALLDAISQLGPNYIHSLHLMLPPHILSVVSSTYRSFSRFPPSLVRSSMKNGWKTSHEFQPISMFSGKNICTHHVFLSETSFFQSKTLPNFCFPPKSAKNSTQIWASHPNKNSHMSTFPKKTRRTTRRTPPQHPPIHGLV